MNKLKITEKHRDVARYIGILIYEGDYDEDISDYIKEESAGIIAQHFPEPPEGWRERAAESIVETSFICAVSQTKFTKDSIADIIRKAYLGEL